MAAKNLWAAGDTWTAFWIYLTAPVLAMQLAAFIHRHSGRVTYCAKLHHHNTKRCIFRCNFGELLNETANAPVHERQLT